MYFNSCSPPPFSAAFPFIGGMINLYFKDKQNELGDRWIRFTFSGLFCLIRLFHCVEKKVFQFRLI